MLDLRVELFQPTNGLNSSGQVVRTWSSAGTFYAQRVVQPNTGSDVMPYDQIVSATIITWRLRYPNSVKATWYLAHDGEDYDIVSVAPEGRQRYILIKTRLRDNGTR